MEKLYTCADIITSLEKLPSNPKAFNTYYPNGWQSISTQEFIDSVKFIALGLKEMGLQAGERVGIVANPSTEWTIADLAIVIAGGISVPLFANVSDENFVYEAKETQLNLLFIEGEDQWAMFHRHQELFKLVIAIDDVQKMENHISWSELKEKGKIIHQQHPDYFQTLCENIKPTDVGAIIYTSGSTGIPKGVELTHQNLTCMLNFDSFEWNFHQDRYLSVLPLAHVFGHCVNLWVLTWGVSIYYCNDYKNLGAICKEIKPTAMVVVPRLLEKICAKIDDQINQATGIKRYLGRWAVWLAKKEYPSWFDQFMYPLANLLVYRKLRESLGGHIRVIISGGAPLNPKLERFFDKINIKIYEGWGLTEGCPICVNRPSKNKMGSVGIPLPRQEVAITSEGEVIVKGTLVMRGYYLNPELTAKTIDKAHWLHTGDRGMIDEEGFLTILGRVKELYKTSTGEYVAPVPIEQALSIYPLIDMSMVVAEGRKFTSCLLFPNFEVLARMKAKKRNTHQTDEEFLKSKEIGRQVDHYIKEINKHLNHWEEIHAYRFILEPLTIQKGELTPSMKIRREVIAKKYSHLIDEMYEEKS